MVENVNLIKEILKEFDLDFTYNKQCTECTNTQSLETHSFSTQVQDDEEYFTLEHPNDSFADVRCLNKQEFLDAYDGLMDTSDYVRYLLEQTDSIVKANKVIPDNVPSEAPKVKIPHFKDAKIGPDLGIMDWNNYHRLEVIYNFMDDLEAMFPSTCTVFVIGQSLEKRDLKILKISNSVASNASVWMDAGIHAREWIAPAVATYVADHIANHFDTLPDYITNKDWYFLPVVNPDGYEYTHTNERLWRKNMAKIKHQYFGVDLNRNFSFGWGGRGSSDIPTHSFYRGTQPFSEPESSAVRDMILNCEIPFKVYITLHSFGQVIIFPLACSDEICPDYIRLLEGATVMSKAIYKCNGNTYKVGISKDVMYPASGTSNDWSYGEAKIPFCYLIELRSKKHRFKLPKEEIAETGNEILNCVIALMEFVDSYPLDSKTWSN